MSIYNFKVFLHIGPANNAVHFSCLNRDLLGPVGSYYPVELTSLLYWKTRVLSGSQLVFCACIQRQRTG